jgi:hypothetical protein
MNGRTFPTHGAGSFAKFGGVAIYFRLHFGHARFEGHDFGVKRTQFALHAERAGFIGAAASDHTALIAGAVRRYKSVLRIFTRKFLGRDGAVGEIRAAQPGEKLFCGRTERIAEFDEFVPGPHELARRRDESPHRPAFRAARPDAAVAARSVVNSCLHNGNKKPPIYHRELRRTHC